MLIGDLADPVRTLTGGSGVWVRPLTTLAGAAKMMTESGIGLLLVEDGSDQVLGVISERDIVAAVADGGDIREERVRDWMTEDVLSVTADTTVRAACAALLEADVRHLVVTDDSQPAGVVSVRELLAVAMASDTATRESLLG